MSELLRETRVVPSDCALVVGIPLDPTSFRRGLASPRGYVAQMAREGGWTERVAGAAWSLYERRVVEPVARAIASARTRGVDVRTDGSLADVTELSAKKRVVTLFAHCEVDAEASAIELGGALLPVDTLAAALAERFDGVLDLALCHSWRIGEVVKRARPGCLVIMHRDQTVPAFRATFYRHLIDLLASGERRYTDATIDLAKELVG
jgi:hypothetical protein